MAVAVRAETNGHRPALAAADVPAAPFEHEELVVRTGERSGAHVVVAIHSTTLGPALGGVRLWPYTGALDAERDALRLAKGMTLKAAAARLDLGGGKGVVRAPEGGFTDDARVAALLDFGDLVESLGGRYVTAEDVGITPDDMVVISQRTKHLTGLPPERGGSGDPSPVTAVGVEAAMRASARERFGSRELTGKRVVIVGLGHVGAGLAELLARDECELVVSDVVADKRELADRLGAGWIDPEHALEVECDVLAPCALGGAIDADTIERLGCKVVCGAANNQLAEEPLAAELQRRGILYAPDFIVNAGGLMSIYGEFRGYGRSRAVELARGIEETMGSVFATARERAITPLEAAHKLARERLGEPRGVPSAGSA